MSETLKEKTAKGLFWGGMNNIVQQVVGLVFGIILGRLLSPSDYGMMAIISVFSLVATALQDSGFKVALTNLREPRHDDYNSVFWFNIIVGAAMYALLFVSAPLIGRYYDTPEVVPLCRYAFLSIVMASLGTAQSAWLFKNLRAKQQAKASMAAVLVSSCVGAGMAFGGMAYWSLATQGLVYVGLNVLLQWHYSPWRPSVRHITFAPVRSMFRFSCKILATTITTHINNNVLNILLGHYFSTRDAGNYNQAYQWNFKCFSLVQNMVSQVAQPMLVDLRGDADRQTRAFRKLMRFTSFISFPLLLGFGLVAHEFIVLAITDKWAESARLIQMLCVSGAFMPLSTLLSNYIVSRGQSGTYFRATAALGMLSVVLMVAMSPLGIRAMVAAYVALNVAWTLVWQRLVARLSGYRLREFAADVLPFGLAAAATTALTGLITAAIAPLWLLLCTRIVVAAVLYYAVMRVARVAILSECVAFVRGKLLHR
ncbi:MAG: lipopolysaccharide biosynthesis protein [Prevotella sp.]|nr:lipopolysaccharide biosynthesis protein [Prevotella sp.]